MRATGRPFGATILDEQNGGKKIYTGQMVAKRYKGIIIRFWMRSDVSDLTRMTGRSWIPACAIRPRAHGREAGMTIAGWQSQNYSLKPEVTSAKNSLDLRFRSTICSINIEPICATFGDI